MEKEHSKRNKLKLIISLVILMSLIGCLTLFTVNYIKAYFNEPNIKLSKDVFEYGEDINFSLLLANNDNVKYVGVSDYTKDKLGEQEIKITLDNGFKHYSTYYNINIVDSIPPEIKLKESKVELEFEEDFDISSNIESCTDNVDGEIDFEILSELDTSKTGTQTIRVSAKDSSNNTHDKEFTVVVKPKKVEIKDNKDTDNTVTNNTSSDSTSSASNITNSKSYLHSVDVSNISGLAIRNDISYIINTVKSDTNYFDYNNIGKEGVNGLNEFLYHYLAFEDPISIIYDKENGDYNFFSFSDEDFIMIKDRLLETEQGFSRYKTFISNSLYNMRLNTTDEDIVNQINKFIVSNFSYKITDLPHNYYFTDSKVGQCMHYAQLFYDMCKSVGIQSNYIEGTGAGGNHAWNSVTIDGTTYYFDPTWNDTSGNTTKYTWLSESKMREDHFW